MWKEEKKVGGMNRNAYPRLRLNTTELVDSKIRKNARQASISADPLQMQTLDTENGNDPENHEDDNEQESSELENLF